MERAYYEEIAGLLRGLQIRLADRLSADDQAAITEYLDANELGLALEHMAEALSEGRRRLSPDERTDLLAVGGRMGIGGDIARALAERLDLG